MGGWRRVRNSACLRMEPAVEPSHLLHCLRVRRVRDIRRHGLEWMCQHPLRRALRCAGSRLGLCLVLRPGGGGDVTEQSSGASTVADVDGCGAWARAYAARLAEREDKLVELALARGHASRISCEHATSSLGCAGRHAQRECGHEAACGSDSRARWGREGRHPGASSASRS
jgi:hypothetical protein